MDKRWIAFFSQTGSELLEISKQLGKLPNTVIYNVGGNNDRPPINEEFRELLWKNGQRIDFTDYNPSIEDYYSLLRTEDVITLHGWLRIIPTKICKAFTIYNGHPGLITKYPELKGKDPQKKAFTLKLKESGCIIHKVEPEVDAGPIIANQIVNIENLGLDAIIKRLHDTSIKMWVDFLREKL